jgi:8-oxo-dGTP diphosphatase
MAASDHPKMHVTVDLVVLTLRDQQLDVLVVERRNEPYRGWPALPGGFVHLDESVRTAAARELAEETGLNVTGTDLHQLSVYDRPDRDPRGRVVSVAFLMLAPELHIPVAGSDARSVQWVPVKDVRGSLAFDHDQILADALEHYTREMSAAIKGG